MNHLKSHFKFSPKQRNGILVLVFLILVLQAVLYFERTSNSQNNIEINEDELKVYRAEVDSLRQVAIENSRPKLYPFNPNFITDYKGYTLGLSNEEIDRLHAFRGQDKWVNSTKQFQDVTEVSDSVLVQISPYFKFPEWVTNPKPKNTYIAYSGNSKPKSYAEKIDLNIASATQLQRVNGIGEKLSQRIVNYRTKIGGFISEVQLQEVYGLSPEVITRVCEHFTVKSPRLITKVALNTANKDQLVMIPHIDYEIAHSIIEQRTLREGFKDIEELTKIEDFPVKKIEIIKLYLTLN